MLFTIVKQYERAVVFFFGKYQRILEPGLRFYIPFIETIHKMDIRTSVIEVEKQDVITKDNVPISIDAVVYLQIVDPKAALLEVKNYMKATSTMAQTLLRSTIGAHTMNEMLSERDKLDVILKEELYSATNPWGIKVNKVEIKSIDLPEGLKRAMAKEAEADRERKAKVISADGELLASEKLSQAAKVISSSPNGLMLRMFQTLTEISAEKNSTILFPIPMEILEYYKVRTEEIQEKNKEDKSK